MEHGSVVWWVQSRANPAAHSTYGLGSSGLFASLSCLVRKALVVGPGAGELDRSYRLRYRAQRVLGRNDRCIEEPSADLDFTVADIYEQHSASGGVVADHRRTTPRERALIADVPN